MIQIDMPMPKNCLDCPACNEYLMCAIHVNGRKWGENDVREFGQGRPGWCPLKEQEAVKPKYNARTNWYECGNCHYSMTSGMHCRSELIPANKVGFCAKCGKAVNWELTIRYIKQNSREDTCKNCPALEVNYNSDEAYCNLADGEEVRLKRGQHRPEWCPKRAWKK